MWCGLSDASTARRLRGCRVCLRRAPPPRRASPGPAPQGRLAARAGRASAAARAGARACERDDDEGKKGRKGKGRKGDGLTPFAAHCCLSSTLRPSTSGRRRQGATPHRSSSKLRTSSVWKLIAGGGTVIISEAVEKQPVLGRSG